MDKEKRVITTQQLLEWEQALDSIVHNPNAHITTSRQTLDILEGVSHEIMSVRL